MGQHISRGSQIPTDLPNAEKTDKNVIREAVVEHLAQDENVAAKRALKHDRHVAGVKQLDRVRSALSPETVTLHWDLDAETLEVDHRSEDGDGGEDVGDVG